jgi:hypothetical protein
MEVFVPFSSYVVAMDFSEDEILEIQSLIEHVFFGLHQEGLIGEFLYAPDDNIHRHVTNAKEGGVKFTPTVLGAQLFLWAHGLGATRVGEFTNSELKFTIDPDVVIPEGFFATSFPQIQKAT